MKRIDLIAQNGNDGLHYVNQDEINEIEVNNAIEEKPKTNKLGKVILIAFFALLMAYFVFIQL